MVHQKYKLLNNIPVNNVGHGTTAESIIDPEFNSFHLDGQTIILDDYLQVRPEKKEAVKKAVQAGKLKIGPFYILQDELIGQVIPNGPAAEAGLKENDKVLSINNQKIKKYEDFTTIVQKNPEKPLTFVVERNGKEEQLTVTPEKQKVEKQTIGKVGVYPYMKTDLPSKLMGGIQDTLNSTTQIFKALGSLFTGFSLNKLGGPVMMFKLSEEASNAGVSTVVFLMAMLSMNLGIIN